MPPTEQIPRSDIALLLVAAFCVIASYLPALHGPFMLDESAIIHNPVLRSLSGLFDLWLSPSLNHADSHYWPLTYTALWLEWHAFGLATPGYHVVNMALHLANMLLAWCFLRLAWPPTHSTRHVPAFAAAIWALHPLQVESVAWIIEIKNLLSTTCVLLSGICLLKHAHTGNRRLLICGSLFFTASLLSKSMSIAWPLVMLAVFWIHRGRFTWGPLSAVAPLIGIALAYAVFDVARVSALEPDALQSPYATWPQRLTQWGPCLCIYALATVFPRHLLAQCMKSVNAPAALLLGCACAGLVWWLARARHRAAAGALCSFALLLAPVCGFFPFRFQLFSLTADRFEYLALLPLMALAGAGIDHIFRRLRRARMAIFVALLIGLSLLTARESRIWGDEVRFWSRADQRESNPFTRARLEQARSHPSGHRAED